MSSEVTGFSPSDASGLVSCICVTQPGRLALVQRAVLNFMEQDYPNRELILMVKDEGYAEQVRTFLSLTLSDLTERARPSISLRTHSFSSAKEAIIQGMAYARGEWICIWDDDNLSHPSRIESQLRYTPEGSASALTKSLYFFYESSELFVSGFEQPGGSPSERCAVSSLMFSRRAYPGFDIANQRQAKDSFAVNFVDRARGAMTLLPHLPYMFITCVHEDNARGAEFHRRAASGLPTTRSRDWILDNEVGLAEALDQYQWPASDVHVSGKDAQAFTYVPEKRWPQLLEEVTVPEPAAVEAEEVGHSCPKGEPGEMGEPGDATDRDQFETQIAGALQEAVVLKNSEGSSSGQED